MQPVISVVMPTYNSEKYLKESMDSILRQTFGDFEFLIVNEFGSDDGTVQVAQSYNDPRVRIIQNTKRLGFARSLNEGIKQAKGKYIARMDSDDISLPHRFAAQASFMNANPDVVVLGAWQKRFGFETDTHKAAAAHDEIKANLLFRSDVCHSVVMLRRKALIDNGLWYDPSYIFEDYELWSRAVHVVRFTNIQEVLGLYRKHEGGLYDRRLTEIIQEEQSIFARSLARLGIDYYAYPRNLIHAHLNRMPMVFGIPSENWAERLHLLRGFFNHILSRNKRFKIYDQECLQHSLTGLWLACLDINADVMAKYNYDKLPFEYIITDILNEAGKIAEGKDVCLFCLGKIGCRALPYFKDYFGERLKCVSDNDPSNWGRKFYGVDCMPPDSLPNNMCVFVTTANIAIADEVFVLLKGFGVECVCLYSNLL